MSDPASRNLGPLWDGTVPTAATALTTYLERFRAAPYWDNPGSTKGTWTFGYGATRDLAGDSVREDTPPITEPQAQTLLQRDMTEAALAVYRNVMVILHTAEASALLSWVYNLGEPALQESHMLAMLNEEQRDQVPAQMGLWINVAGVPSLGLRRRRWAEGGIFLGLPAKDAIWRAWAEIMTVEDWPAY